MSQEYAPFASVPFASRPPTAVDLRTVPAKHRKLVRDAVGEDTALTPKSAGTVTMEVERSSLHFVVLIVFTATCASVGLSALAGAKPLGYLAWSSFVLTALGAMRIVSFFVRHRDLTYSVPYVRPEEYGGDIDRLGALKSWVKVGEVYNHIHTCLIQDQLFDVGQDITDAHTLLATLDKDDAASAMVTANRVHEMLDVYRSTPESVETVRERQEIRNAIYRKFNV